MKKTLYLLTVALALALSGIALSACGETEGGSEGVAPHDHVYEWVVTKEATCLEEGEERQECTVCHETGETRQTEKAAHTPEPIPEVKATCTTKGKTAGVKCSVCDTILEEQTETEMLPHTSDETWHVDETQGTHYHTCTVCGSRMDETAHEEETIPEVKATCTTKGKTAGKKCSVCETVLQAQTDTDMIAHTPGEEYFVGTKGHYQKCTVCETALQEEDHTAGATYIDDKSGKHYQECTACQAKMNETEHTAGENWVQGAEVHYKECTACQAKMNETACTPDNEWHTDSANHYYECTVCKQHLQEAAHVEHTIPGEEATCTAKGKTDGKDCSVCGAILQEQTETEMIAHTPDGGWHTDASAGTHYHVCQVCETQYDLAEHSSESPAVADGSWWHAKYCDVCKEKFDREECDGTLAPIDKNEHYFNCDVCGTRRESGHYHAYEPDPTDETTHTDKCKCGWVFANEKHSIPTSQGRYKGTYTTETHSFTCKCGKVFEGAHDFVDDVGKNSSGTQKCSVCGISLLYFSKNNSTNDYSVWIQVDNMYLNGFAKGQTLKIPAKFNNLFVRELLEPRSNSGVDYFAKLVSSRIGKLGDTVFNYNTSLETIVFPMLESMERFGFAGTKFKNLKTIVFGKKLQSINETVVKNNLPADAAFYFNGDAEDWAAMPELVQTQCANYTVYFYSMNAAPNTWHWQDGLAQDTPVLWESAPALLSRNVALLPNKEW